MRSFSDSSKFSSLPTTNRGWRDKIPVSKQQDFRWKDMGSNPVKVYFYNHLAVEFVH